MPVYLHKIPRPDILVETGGSLDENEAHVTSSTLRIYMPADSKDIAACDYIQLVENDIVIFAGTVMEAEQENLDNVDLSYKIYNLTLTNNSDYIASVFVDMTFPSGASVTQILMGNRPGQSWYDASLGEFYGIIPVRVENEGITAGEIDDFTGITLNSPAYLWGRLFPRDRSNGRCMRCLVKSPRIRSSICGIPTTEAPRRSALIPIQRFIT
ncbi:MAG: hypothetical protein ACLVD7_03990 [[Clostridium] leptum]